MSNNIAFEGNPENIQRFLLQHEFQHRYQQFDAKTVSHDAAPITTGVSQNNIAYVLKRFAELGFIDELECALITASVDESELISSARRFWPRAWYPDHENTGYELTLLTVTKDNINNRPLCF